ncbi:HGL016Cp [Eremothecium sinecaudum]|uniref:Coatomer subunit zeta n=1 Tax=Eremothecium sinecaudum TaxID=45286 RepID=A0A0X8HVM9_9SACH|nr:HGL016Cp [Eremothecium sinecaudum]AMD22324.1 HGL016Cp [Eremothecium sinecaudum]
MVNLSLYAIQGVLILDNEGKRVFTKYFHPPHEPVSDGWSFSTVKKQKEFEAKLFKKTYKKNAEILILEDRLVLYKECANVILYVMGSLEENEIVLQDTLNAIKVGIEVELNTDIDKKAIQDNYDVVCLVVDEVIDDGIILETELRTINSRVTKAPTNEPTITIDLSEKGLLSAWGFAKSKLAETLQQGL